MLEFTCPSCGEKRKLPEDVRKKKFLCPKCNIKILHMGDAWFEVMETTVIKRAKRLPAKDLPDSPKAGGPAT